MEMEVITKRQIINSASKRWKRGFYREASLPYYPKGEWLDSRIDSSNGLSCEEIYNELINLETNCTEDEVIELTKGNGSWINEWSWTANNCDECRKDVDVAIKIGTGYGEYRREKFCLDCITKAKELLEQASVVKLD